MHLTVNQQSCCLDVEPDTPLLFALRNHLELTAAKLGCGLEQCGACAVLVNGAATLTCQRATADFADARIETLEGLHDDPTWQRLQQAMVAERAAQCGYCSSGIVIALVALLRHNQQPSRADVAQALDGHLCRCGAHARIFAAVERATRAAYLRGTNT